jgi:polysaccharide pyruvyl transferase WcaK-like protein
MIRPLGAPTKIGLLGMYASANLGDTAIQRAVMKAVTERRQNIEFIGLCTDPLDAARTFGIRARHLSGSGPMIDLAAGAPAQIESAESLGSANRWPTPIQRGVSAWRIDRQMQELDMLLVSGSGQIDDFWGGPWEQPFRLLSWCAAARRQKKPVVVFGVGVDQLLTRLGTRFCKWALASAQLRVLRDGGSLDAVRAMGMLGATEVCPDPAFHLTAKEPYTKQVLEAPFAVISPIAKQAWPEAGADVYEAYLVALAAAADELQRQATLVRFVCSQTRMDPPVVDRVKQLMQTDSSKTQFRPVETVDAYIDEVRCARVVVGSRLHALILAFVAGTPVVAISYARKVERQLQDMQLAEFVLDLRTVKAPELLATLNRALSSEARLRNHIRSMTTDFHRQLDVQFDRLAALVPQ